MSLSEQLRGRRTARSTASAAFRREAQSHPYSTQYWRMRRGSEWADFLRYHIGVTPASLAIARDVANGISETIGIWFQRNSRMLVRYTGRRLLEVIYNRRRTELRNALIDLEYPDDVISGVLDNSIGTFPQFVQECRVLGYANS